MDDRRPPGCEWPPSRLYRRGGAAGKQDSAPALETRLTRSASCPGIPDAIHADLGELAAGLKPGRRDATAALAARKQRRARRGHGYTAIVTPWEGGEWPQRDRPQVA